MYSYTLSKIKMSTTQEVKPRAGAYHFNHRENKYCGQDPEIGWPYGIFRCPPGSMSGNNNTPWGVVSRDDGDVYTFTSAVQCTVSSTGYQDVHLEVGESVFFPREPCCNYCSFGELELKWNDPTLCVPVSDWWRPKTADQTARLTIYQCGHVSVPSAQDATQSTATCLPTKRPRTRSETQSGHVPVPPTKKMKLLPAVKPSA